MKNLIIAAMLCVATGCASTAPTGSSTPASLPSRQQGVRPALLVDTSARVGETIYTAYDYREIDQSRRLVLEREVRGRFVVSNVIVPLGTPLIEGNSGFFCTEQKLYSDPIVGPWRPVCFQDADNSGKFERFGVRPGLIWLWQSLGSMDAIYRVEEGKKVTLDGGGYRKELIYQGVDRATLRVVYREYLKDIARPALTQDLTYPITDGIATIVFRNLTINVHSVSGEAVTYRVISGSL